MYLNLCLLWGAVCIKTKISSIGYVNKIRDNVLGISRKSLLPLYEELKAADCVVCGGSGRSLYSLNAAMSQIAISQVGWRNKVVLTPDDPGSQARTCMMQRVIWKDVTRRRCCL